MRTQKTTEPKQNGEMEPTLVGVTVSPEECTLNGNKQMLITFYEGTQFPSGSTIVAVFRGSEGTNSVCAKQLNSLTYTVLIPAVQRSLWDVKLPSTVKLLVCCQVDGGSMADNLAHHKPEQVTLSLIIDSREKSRVIYRSHFLYTAAPEHYIAELLVQSVSGTPQLDALLSFVPPLKTKADHIAFDNKLTETFSAIALPRDWTLIGYKNLKRVETGSTLLHFSARLGLAKFTCHLLSLPGAREAVNMDNKWGLSPVDIAGEISSNDTAKLLNDFAAAVDNCSTQHPLLSDGLSEQQQHQDEGCYGDVPVTTGGGYSGPSITSDIRQDKRQQQQHSPTVLDKIKPKFRGATAAVSNNKDLLTNLTSTFSNSCPTLVNAVEQQAMNGENSAIEFTCPSTPSTNSDELPCSSSEDSPEPKHRHGNNHKSPPMEKKNGVMMSTVPKTVSPHLTSQLNDSGVPPQSRNCTNSPDTREDSVTPVQVNQYSDQEGTLKRQSSTPVPSVVKSASAESSPPMQRVTSISLYVKSPKSRPPSQHQVTLQQAVESDDIMETQSAPNLFSAIGDHDSLTTIIDHDDDDRNADSTTPTATTTINDIMYNDNSSHPECTDTSSDSEVSSINDIHVLMKNSNLKEQHNQQQVLRRYSQQGISVKHSVSDHCLLERAISPTDAARKRHSDILGESPNEGVLYSTGSEPFVSKPHNFDLNWSSNDEYLEFADSNDTLDELCENQSDDGRDGMIEYQQHSNRSVGRPHSAEISHMVLEAKIRQIRMHAHALSSSSSQHSAIRKVHSSSEIDSINATKSVAAFRSHNKLHPKLVEEMYSVPEGDDKLSYSYPSDAASLRRSGDKISKMGISKTKKSHPVSRNNSDVTGLKKQTSHASVKRSASAVSDSAYTPGDRLLSRDSKDYPSSQDSSTLSLRGSSSGGAALPPSPLISTTITPVELNAPLKRRSGTLSPSIPRLPAEDEEPVENVMSQPSIAGIMQARKPMVHCDPEIESSLDRPIPETPPAMQKTQKKGDNKTNLKRAQTMVAAESEGSQSRKFWNFRTKHKQKKKYATTVKVTNKTSSTYPRPSSASSNYSPDSINALEESSTSNQSTEPETSNVFPVKQMSHRQSGNRIEVRNIHFSPTVSPTERPVTAAPAATVGDNTTGASQPKAAISTSSSNLHTSKMDLTEPPRKIRSSSDLCESEKEIPGNTNDTSVEDDECLTRTQEDESVAKTFLACPELYPDHKDNAVWSDNVPPKVLSKLSKSERDRQAVIYELVQTENHILVAIQILLIVFKKSFHEELKLPEEITEQMFPHLEPLLALTQEFYRKLKQRQDEARNHIVDRIGDVLIEHFTGDKGDQVAKVYGAFCSRQLRALGIYREQNKVKRFQKLATSFANTQVCQRRNYPEFITLLAQRITKYPHLVARLSKKTDPKHRDAKDLELALTHSVKVTSQVNQIVDDQSRHEKLLDIQMNLEVHLPRWEKDDATRKELKSLNLMANGRNMIKKGPAKWVGSQHSQELPVLIVLVTDMVVILVERDQKYSLACLQDRKPPVIRLYDLIVRVNEASAKSAVCELFLMEGGTRPEFYTIQLANEKELMEWKKVIHTQIEYCKQNNLKCERFGSGHITSSTTEDKKDHRVTNHPHEKVKHDSVKKREKKKGIGKKEKYLSLCGEALELARNMLSYSPSLQDLAQLQQVTRHGTSVVAIPTANVAKNSSYVDKSSPKTRSRANTIVHFKPPLTTDDIATTAKSAKQHRVKGKGTKVERSQTFLGKEEKKERPHTAHSTYAAHHRSSSSASGGGIGVDDLPDGALFGAYQQPPRDQLQLKCIVKLVEALEGMQELVEDQDSAIENLQAQLSAIKSQLDQSARTLDSDATPLEEMTSRTENDLLTMIDNQLSEQQALSGMSLEDLRHFSSNAYHSGTRQQNGSVTTGRPQSYSELPSNDILPSWSSSLTEQDAINYSRTMSSTDTS